MFRSLWDYFIPDELRQDADTLRQANRVVAFDLAMLFWVPVFTIVYRAIGAPVSSDIVLLAGPLLIGNLYLFVHVKSTVLCGNIVTAIPWLVYTLLAIFNGGAGSPSTMWYASVPVLSLLAAGYRSGIWWTALTAVQITVFAIVREHGYDVPNELTVGARRFLEYSAQLGIVGCVFFLVSVLMRVEHKSRQALREALVRAEGADRAKSMFLANMSHEIRTPMTAILGFCDFLKADECLDAVQTIRRNGEHLLQIINDILDLSKIEAGRMTVEILNCSPVEIIRDVVKLMQIRTDSKGLSLNVEFAGPIPATIHTDPTRLRQILINLIGNAVKFTQEGGVRVRVGLSLPEAQDPSAQPRLQLVVADTGIGMTGEQIANLFQPFTQADGSMSRRFGGTGLGLTISKRLATMLGGNIAVTSQPGIGSVFQLTIATGPLDGVPMLSNLSEERKSSALSALREEEFRVQLDCRILLAEDGADNQRLISHILRHAGANVTIVADGLAATEAALQARDHGCPYDLILTDMQMPVMDGYTATAKLRSEGYTGAIVALTAHAMSGDREACLAAGCDDYVSKPIRRSELFEVIGRYCPVRS